MKLDTAFGEFETDQSDAELARAVADTAASLKGVADAMSDRPDGECDNCGDRAALRPIAVQDDDGGFGAIQVCRDCQAEFVDEHLSRAAEQQAAAATAEPEDPVADLEGTPTPDEYFDA